MASNYGKKIAQLSSKIFMEIENPSPQLTKVLKLFKEKPHQHVNINWYSPVEELTSICKHLRHMGLYRDEHAEFNEELKRIKELKRKLKAKNKPEEKPSKK